MTRYYETCRFGDTGGACIASAVVYRCNAGNAATKCNGCTMSARCGRFPIRWSLKKSEFNKFQELSIMESISIDQIKEIIGSDSNMKEKIDSLPYNLKLCDLIDFLGYCESTVYKITRQPDFPKLDTGVKKFLVPRPLFLYWYFRKCFFAKQLI